MTEKEHLALRHIRSEFKLDYKTDDSSKMANIYRRKGWLTDDKEALNLIKNGAEEFRKSVAERIIRERKSDLYLNECSKCGLITRTPQSRQCRHCGNKWHEIKVADFKLNGAFQLNNRGFYIIGALVNGKAEKGNFIDLTMLGINCKPEIKNIELVLKNTDGTEIDDVGFETSELTEQQKERLIKIGSFGTPFDIVNSR